MIIIEDLICFIFYSHKSLGSLTPVVYEGEHIWGNVKGLVGGVVGAKTGLINGVVGAKTGLVGGIAGAKKGLVGGLGGEKGKKRGKKMSRKSSGHKKHH